MICFEIWWNSADADAFRAKHEEHDGAEFKPVWDAAVRAMLDAAPAAPAVAPAQDAFDVALTALDRYQHNWDTGLPGEYAQPERIHMECAVEAVREALTEARDAAPAQAEQQGMCEHYDFRSSCQECRKAEQQGESYKCSRCGSSTTLGCTGMGCGYLESGVGEPEQQGDDCCHGCAPASECKVECGGLKEQQGSLSDAVERTIKVIERQLELIAERAPGDFLDKRPVVQSLKAHKVRLQRALATKGDGHAD